MLEIGSADSRKVVFNDDVDREGDHDDHERTLASPAAQEVDGRLE